MPASTPTARQARSARPLLIAAWLVGGISSAVMAYFEYYAIAQDVDYSHTSLLGYPGYCLALVVTTALALLHARKAYDKTWTKGTIAITAWTVIAIVLTLFVTNSTS